MCYHPQVWLKMTHAWITLVQIPFLLNFSDTYNNPNPYMLQWQTDTYPDSTHNKFQTANHNFSIFSNGVKLGNIPKSKTCCLHGICT